MAEHTSNRSRLGRCEVCENALAKYTCPRCEIKTCCVECVKIHKKELNCDGQRDRTAYKSINEFSNLDLRNDYNLLEDINRNVQGYATDKRKLYTRIQTPLPIQLYRLRAAAYKRGVRLLFLPQNFSKHQENTTYLCWKKQDLYWRLEWNFIAFKNIKCINERSLDTAFLGSIASEHLKKNESLQEYADSNFDTLSFLLKAEKTFNKYYKLDVESTLRKNLENKLILEYPSIHVILKSDLVLYNIIESDANEMNKFEKSEFDMEQDPQQS